MSWSGSPVSDSTLRPTSVRTRPVNSVTEHGQDTARKRLMATASLTHRDVGSRKVASGQAGQATGLADHPRDVHRCGRGDLGHRTVLDGPRSRVGQDRPLRWDRTAQPRPRLRRIAPRSRCPSRCAPIAIPAAPSRTAKTKPLNPPMIPASARSRPTSSSDGGAVHVSSILECSVQCL